MQNITSSLINFIPEIILFTMSMVILLIGTFERLKKYVFHLTILSVFLASLISVNYLDNDLNIKTIFKKDINFDWRYSHFQIVRPKIFLVLFYT